MVQVGHVRVRVHQGLVPVRVLVPGPRWHLGDVLVVVVTLVVRVLVVVLHCRVVVRVLVGGPEHETDADAGDGQRTELRTGDPLPEDEPGEERPEERGRREHHLGPRGSEIPSAGHPQSDRGPVAERPDQEREKERPGRREPGCGDPDDMPAGQAALGERATAGSLGPTPQRSVDPARVRPAW